MSNANPTASGDFVRRNKIFAMRPAKPGRRTHYATTRRMYILKIWSRDCDMCESTSIVAIPATAEALREIEDREWRNAEGPWTISFLSEREATEFSPSFRDRAMEAYENGFGANAYSV